MTKPDTLNEQVGVLTRREIEARILRPLVERLGERFGHDAVLEVLRDVVVDAARDTGRSMRDASDGDDATSFRTFWEPWFRGGALEIRELEQSEDRWSFDVTRCRYAELYRSLGMEDLGATLSCNRDAALVEGFSGTLRLERTQTIMEGATHCDFRYRRVVEGSAAEGETSE